jgi:hypothetical protein
MIFVIAKLHDYAEKLEDKYGRHDLADMLDKIATELVARYRFRIKRPRKSRGTTRTRRKLYYKTHRQKLRTRMKRYRSIHRTQLKRRRGLRHYHRFG